MTMSDEKSDLLRWLGIQREHVLGALEGLSDDDLRRPVLPTGWTGLGWSSTWRSTWSVGGSGT